MKWRLIGDGRNIWQNFTGAILTMGLNDRDRDVRKDNPEVFRCEVRRIRHAKDEEWKIRR